MVSEIPTENQIFITRQEQMLNMALKAFDVLVKAVVRL
jgi:hypothetical protein